MVINIKKDVYDPLTRSVLEDYPENKEIVVNGEETFRWNFSTGPPQYSVVINGMSIYIFHLWLKIECSFPKSQQPVLNATKLEDACLTNFSEFFNNPSYGDFEVKVGNETFNVSRVVLTVGSPTFKAMFISQLSESKENCLEVNDFSPSVIKKLLQFLYDSETPLEDDLEQAEKLVAAADKYQINKLRERCEQIMLKNLNIENAARLVIFADRHQCATLRQACIVLICTNYADFIKTEDCKKLHKEFTELAIEISGAAAQYKH
ncbi:Speckle-type POZ protein-like protein [Aphelenchoides bicaudatus]|nr:Speckle-type POZ protein-like protein [Aphelenchoides bicaudatus]